LTSLRNESIVLKKDAKRERKEVMKLQIANYEEVISNIKKIIEMKGIKQGVVAERAGFTPQDFSNMLNERRKLIRIEHIPRIAGALGVDINELFTLPERAERW